MAAETAKRSVKESLATGKPYLNASGIKKDVYHRRGCPIGNACTCGLDSMLNRLALGFTDILDSFGPEQP